VLRALEDVLSQLRVLENTACLCENMFVRAQIIRCHQTGMP